MTPLLPANPMTITPPDQPRTRAQVMVKYLGLVNTPLTFAKIRADLKFLRDLDSHTRETDPDRELAKQALRCFLRQEP